MTLLGIDSSERSFGKALRLREKKEFDKVFRRGRRKRSEYFEFIKLPNGLDRSRLGLVVSRKVGPAVTRNRVKRMAREIFRQNAFQYENIDLVVRAYPAARNATFMDVLRDFDLVLPSQPNERLFDTR